MALTDKLNEIENLVKELDNLPKLSAEMEGKLWRKYRLEFNYNSNHIEGNTLTYGQTELLLIFDKTTGDHQKRELDEMQAHDVALKMVVELAKDKERDLNETFIKELNKRILVQPFYKEAITPNGQKTRREITIGDYKKFPNSVLLQNGETFEYATPEETPAKMGDLMTFYKDKSINFETNPIWLAAMIHYQFVRIHPFDDGNGRISRLLMNYILLKNNLPPIIIKSADKANYLTALNKADTGDINAFIEYIAEQLIWSLQLKMKAAKGESFDEADDYLKEIKLLEQKTENTDIAKSPKIVYQVFNAVEKEVWFKLEKTLQSFDKLFNESKTTHTVGGLEEKYEDYNVLASMTFIRSGKPKGLKIFGHDVYEYEPSNVEWKHIKYSLKGGKKNTNYNITFSITFSEKEYSLTLYFNGIIDKVSKKYNDLLLSDNAEKMNKILQDYMLETIKGNIEQ